MFVPFNIIFSLNLFSQSYVYDDEEGDWMLKSMTNRAMLEAAFTTHTYKNAYVYQDFSYEHCAREGITFKKIPKQ